MFGTVHNEDYSAAISEVHTCVYALMDGDSSIIFRSHSQTKKILFNNITSLSKDLIYKS